MFEENLGAFLADFGDEYEFVREPDESSSSSAADESVVTLTMIKDAPPFEFSAYDRSFYDEKHYEATGVMAKVRLLGVETEMIPIEINDKTNFGGQDWYVIGKTPDGTGMAVIGLSDSPVLPE